MCTKENALKKVKEVENHIRKEPVKSVAVAAGVGLGLGILIGCFACKSR